MDETDADWICEMLGNPDVTRLLQFTPIDRNQFLEKHRSYVALNAMPSPFGSFVLEEDGARAGYAFIRKFEWEPELSGVPELGYLIEPRFWGKGIATALVRFLTERAAKGRLLAIIDDRHVVSRRVALKSGFSRIIPSKKHPGNSIWEKIGES